MPHVQTSTVRQNVYEIKSCYIPEQRISYKDYTKTLNYSKDLQKSESVPILLSTRQILIENGSANTAHVNC